MRYVTSEGQKAVGECGVEVAVLLVPLLLLFAFVVLVVLGEESGVLLLLAWSVFSGAAVEAWLMLAAASAAVADPAPVAL